MRPLRLLALSALLSAAPVLAGETGSISGVLRNADGQPAARVTVRASGPQLPGGREAETGDHGEFRFPQLPPGPYVVSATVGLGATRREVVVTVDNDLQIELDLPPTRVETVEVSASAETPVADLKSTEVNFNYRAELIEKLPLQRSYKGLFQLVPGIPESTPDSTETESSLGPPAGGSRQDNTYLIDGVNITNPGFGYLSTEINELDVLDFNVKRGAISAEFGRTAGMITNAVTRSGTNAITGTARFEMQPRPLVAESKDPDLASTTDRWVPALAIGGPFVKDHFFWYASGRLFRSTVGDRRNLFGALPDRVEEVDEAFGKLTWHAGPRHSLNVSHRRRPQRIRNGGLAAFDAPSLATDSDNLVRISRGEWNWLVSSRGVLEVKFLHLHEDTRERATTDLGFRPAPFDIENLQRMGRFTAPGSTITIGGAALLREDVRSARNELRAAYTRFFSAGATSHQLKAGMVAERTSEDLDRRSNGWGTIVVIPRDEVVQATYYPVQPTQRSRSRTYGLFLQDAITWSRVTVNAGLLVNHDAFAQDADGRDDPFLTFGFGRQVQPRLGVNYALRAGAGDKVYANFGRYYNLDQKSSARSLAPDRQYVEDAFFDLEGAFLREAPRATTLGKPIDPALDPTYTDEFLAGYATPLWRKWGLDVVFLYRASHDFIEDRPRVLPAADFWVTNVAGGVRRFRALTVELTRRHAEKWGATLSYQYSQLAGNFDLDFNGGGNATRTAAVFNTSSVLEDGPGLFVGDTNRYGEMSQDRPHVLKLFAIYTPSARLTLGGYYRLQSGTPWAAKGRDYYDGYNVYLQPAGARRNPTWHNVDLLAAWHFAVEKRLHLTLEARVLNALDRQTVLFVDQRQFLDARIRLADPPYLAQGVERPNPAFGRATEFAAARRLLLTALVSF
ncbi:MAG TPA: carboxypeptidase regulatory-like domain-containing protein, partial [Vicinamibacteria bacterium]|nr:carboxypeptidase regulatory-like domain-containing protein [Vicinamibacteria bacterium]